MFSGSKGITATHSLSKGQFAPFNFIYDADTKSGEAGIARIVSGSTVVAKSPNRFRFQNLTTGGGALIGNVAELAEEVLGLPVRLGIPQDIAKSSFKLIDLDNSGCLRFSEFAAFFIETKAFDDDMLREVFDVLDGDGKGFVTTADIDRMLDEEASEEGVDEKITFEEFKRVMRADTNSTKKKKQQSTKEEEEEEKQTDETDKERERAFSDEDKAKVASSFAEACSKSRALVNKTRNSDVRLRFRSRVRAVQEAKMLLRGSKNKSN